jgi:hypothetical protein
MWEVSDLGGIACKCYVFDTKYHETSTTGQVVGLEVSSLRVVGSYPTQWTSMYVLVNLNPYGTR